MVQAFDALEAPLSTSVRKKYRHRMEESYDLDGSPTFMAWKKLYTDSHLSSQQTKSTNNANEAPEPELRGYMVFQTRETTSNQLNSSGEVLKEILTYPTLETKASPKRKNLKRTLPNFVSGPEAMQHVSWQENKRR